MNGIEYKVIKVRFEDKLHDEEKINTITNIYKDGIGIACKDGEVVITEFIPSGKKQMLVNSYLNGIDKNKLLGERINEEWKRE